MTRHNNFFLLIIGRLFDGQVLDMAEFGVDKFVSMHEIKVICPHLKGYVLYNCFTVC